MSGSCLTLKHGIPICGLGTFRSTGKDVQVAVAAALDNGIRHIDTAAIYKNEEDIAAALKQHGVPRTDVYITSKVSPYQQGTENATAACEQILQKLQTDYLVLEHMYRTGKAKAIGVSNYSARHLQELLDKATVKPVVNQFEVHPRRPETALRQFCAAQDVDVVAYASLGCGDLLKNPVVLQLAEKNNKSAAQVLLRWGSQQGCAVIPKSVHPEYIKQYGPEQLLTWQLSSGDMAALDGLEDGHKYCWDASDVS
eukprot:gene4683-4936_t